MRILTLAAGVAVGYVLGSRAGREKYEEIAATARKVGEHPTVVQAQEKAKELLNTGAKAAVAKVDPNTDTTRATDTTRVTGTTRANGTDVNRGVHTKPVV